MTQIEQLLARSPQQVNQVERGDTPLLSAFSMMGEGCPPSVRLLDLLLSRGANPNAQQGSLRDTPMHYAAQANRVDWGELLLKRGANVNIKGYRGMTPLHTAMKMGALFLPPAGGCSPEMMYFLTQHGADLMARDDAGHHPSSYAIGVATITTDPHAKAPTTDSIKDPKLKACVLASEHVTRLYNQRIGAPGLKR
jgi:ankyrin repeat protein